MTAIEIISWGVLAAFIALFIEGAIKAIYLARQGKLKDTLKEVLLKAILIFIIGAPVMFLIYQTEFFGVGEEVVKVVIVISGIALIVLVPFLLVHGIKMIREISISDEGK